MMHKSIGATIHAPWTIKFETHFNQQRQQNNNTYCIHSVSTQLQYLRLAILIDDSHKHLSLQANTLKPHTLQEYNSIWTELSIVNWLIPSKFIKTAKNHKQFTLYNPKRQTHTYFRNGMPIRSITQLLRWIHSTNLQKFTSKNVDLNLDKHLHSSDKVHLLQFHVPNDEAADIERRSSYFWSYKLLHILKISLSLGSHG